MLETHTRSRRIPAVSYPFSFTIQVEDKSEYFTCPPGSYLGKTEDEMQVSVERSVTVLSRIEKIEPKHIYLDFNRRLMTAFGLSTKRSVLIMATWKTPERTSRV